MVMVMGIWDAAVAATTTVGAEAAGITMVGTGAAITDGIRCIDMLRPPRRRGGLIGYRILFNQQTPHGAQSPQHA